MRYNARKEIELKSGDLMVILMVVPHKLRKQGCKARIS